MRTRVYRRQGTKKRPRCHCIKDESISLRGTTLFRPDLTAGALERTGGSDTPVHSVRGSETMFSAAFHTPSHQPGLSVTYLRTYSSLHCLCQRYSIVSGLHLVYPGEAALSMVRLIKKAGLTKRGLCQTRQFLYIAPGMCRSFLIFFPASLSPRFFPLGVMRLSRRTAMRVPTDWKICTSTTRTMTAT